MCLAMCVLFFAFAAVSRASLSALPGAGGVRLASARGDGRRDDGTMDDVIPPELCNLCSYQYIYYIYIIYIIYILYIYYIYIIYILYIYIIYIS